MARICFGKFMRLICPKCEAQYEVEASVIPEDGRDVQCSNCGHTWYQVPEARDPDAAGSDASQGPQAPAPEPGEEDADDEDAEEGEPGAAARADLSEPAAQRRALDDEILEILREEAAREKEARRKDVASETFAAQPDLGLDSGGLGARRGGHGASVSPHGREEAVPDGEVETAPEADPRPVNPDRAGHAERIRDRETLPDAEAISSTLSASVDRARPAQDPEEAERAERRGFRRGFALVVGIAAIGLALYLLAPQIGGLNPGMARAMEAYVALIDGWRGWLHGILPDALKRPSVASTGG